MNERQQPPPGRAELKKIVEQDYSKDSVEEKAVRFQSYWEALLEVSDYVQQKGAKLGELPGALELLPEYALAKYEGIKDRLSWMSREKRESRVEAETRRIRVAAAPESV